jgi:hypothetical protein
MEKKDFFVSLKILVCKLICFNRDVHVILSLFCSGGWNVLRDFRASDFDFPRLLRKVQSDHRVSPFFKITVVPNPESPSRNIIKITPSGLSLPHPSYYFIQNGPVSLPK